MRLPRKNTKARSVLNYFLAGASANRFEAERHLHDHCLHSTVSTLQNEYGIHISRITESVPGFEGNRTQCCRYWIEPDERERIKKVPPKFAIAMTDREREALGLFRKLSKGNKEVIQALCKQHDEQESIKKAPTTSDQTNEQGIEHG